MGITPYYSAINLSCRLTSITGLRRNKRCSVRTDEASFVRLPAHCYSVACAGPFALLFQVSTRKLASVRVCVSLFSQCSGVPHYIRNRLCRLEDNAREDVPRSFEIPKLSSSRVCFDLRFATVSLLVCRNNFLFFPFLCFFVILTESRFRVKKSHGTEEQSIAFSAVAAVSASRIRGSLNTISRCERVTSGKL